MASSRSWPFDDDDRPSGSVRPLSHADLQAILAHLNGFLVRVRYEDLPTPDQRAISSAGCSNGGKGRAPGNSRGPRREDQPG
jgi:hypothetical protein